MMLATLPLFLAALVAAQATASDFATAELPRVIQSQQVNGSWDGDRSVGSVGVTSFMVLSMIADGHTRTRGRCKGPVEKGAHWLFSQQDLRSGCIGVFDVASLANERELLDHAWATYALSELAHREGESPSEAELEARMLAVQALLGAQLEDGSFGTARATGWAAFALVSARESGLSVDAAKLTAVRDALQRMVPLDGDPAHLDGGKVALRCLISFMVRGPTEAQSTDQAAIAAMARVVKVPDLWDALDPESRMLVTFAALHCGGETWKNASAGIKTSVLPREVRGGHLHGSFRPERGFGETRATAVASLTLYAYFRYANILGMRRSR